MREKTTPEQRLKAALIETIESVAETLNRSTGAFSLTPVNPVRILLAYSGGRDSEAMLNVLAGLVKREKLSSVESVTVMHVNHGISDNAEDWAEQCQANVESLGFPFILKKVYVSKMSPEGVEAAAREARYRALYKAAKRIGADVILTAHHMDDQLETFLIQWMRGAGPEGLAALPRLRSLSFSRKGETVLLARPWLHVERACIDRYVTKKKLAYIEDESNADTRYLRNLIRHELFPIFEKGRLGWKSAASRSIDLLGQSVELMREIALSDTNACRSEAGTLSVERLRLLSPSRQALVLREWLSEASIRAPSQGKLTDVLRQVNASNTDTALAIRFGDKQLRRWGDRLLLREEPKAVRTSERDMTLTWQGESELSLGAWGGVLRFEPCHALEDGFDAALLRAGPLYVRPRKGGEKIKIHPFRPSRHLKHLYQEADIASFDRDALPLVWLGEELIYAAGLGSEVRLFADQDLVSDRVKLTWVPDKALFE